LIDKAELLKIFDREQRRDVEFFGQQREVLPRVVRHIATSPAGGGGCVVYSDLAGAHVATVVNEQIEYFEGIGQNFEWKVYEHDMPPDLRQRLADRGFEVEDQEAVLVLDLASAPDHLWRPVLQDVRRIQDPKAILDVMVVEEQVWNDPFPGLGEGLAEELGDNLQHLSVFVAYAGGLPVSTAWIRYHPPTQFASLWGGSTVERYRGQGFYKALLAVRAQEARERGVRFLTVDASPMSRPILERLGFQLITFAYACKWNVAVPS
jgi:GNAT superfamily N-acetyltransferase